MSIKLKLSFFLKSFAKWVFQEEPWRGATFLALVIILLAEILARHPIAAMIFVLFMVIFVLDTVWRQRKF